MKLLSIFMAILVVTTSALALDVKPANYKGEINKSIHGPSNQLKTIGFANLISYHIGWNITDAGNGSFRYSYDLANIKGISLTQANFFLETGAGVNVNSLHNIQINGLILDPLLTHAVDATMGKDQGILFQSLGSLVFSSISFTVDASPVWGDFAHSSTLGLLGSVENNGFGTKVVNSTIAKFIVTPGGLHRAPVATPEPAVYLSLGSLLVGFAIVRRKRLSKAKANR